jgi:hypothetical protein
MRKFVWSLGFSVCHLYVLARVILKAFGYGIVGILTGILVLIT